MKLTRLTILSIGLFLGLTAVAFFVFQHVLPNIEETRNYRENAQALRAEINKSGMAKQRVEDAVTLIGEKADEWNAIMARHSLPGSLAAGGIDLAVNEYQLTVDARRFRNSVQSQLNRQLKYGGVQVIGPEIPMPTDDAASVLASYFNYSSFGFPAVLYNLGQVTVTGTFDQIMTHVRGWSNMPNFLAVADGLQISGTSPNMTGTYNLTIVGFIQSERVFPPIGGGGGAAPAATGATTPGGPPSGVNVPSLPPGQVPGRGGMGRDEEE